MASVILLLLLMLLLLLRRRRRLPGDRQVYSHAGQPGTFRSVETLQNLLVGLLLKVWLILF
jgi:hypothetical protein